MAKNLRRAVAIVCAAACVAALSGCSDTSWALKVDGAKIPAGMYIYSVMNVTASIQSNYENYYGTTTLDWTQKVGTQDLASYIKDQALKNCEDLYAIEQLCKQENVSLTASEKASADSTASTAYSSSTSTYSANGVSAASIKRYVEDTQLSQKLYTHYYGTSGTKKVTEKDAAFKSYCDNYSLVKQILVETIATTSSGTSSSLTGTALTNAEKKANEAYAAAKKDPSKFDSLITKYSQDTSSSNQSGYLVEKGSSSYVTAFTNGAFSIKVGQVTMVKSSEYGYHILYRMPLVTSTMLSQYKQKLMTDLIDSTVKKYKIEKNASTLSAFDPKKLSSQ